MLQKILAISFLVLFIGRVLFRPQLKQLGTQIETFANFLVVAIAISYGVQLILLLTG